MTAPEQPPSGDPVEAAAWCSIVGTNGRTVRTNAYTDYPAGSAFVAVLDTEGVQIGQWLSIDWAEPTRAQATMTAILTALGAEHVHDDEYGPELTWRLDGGELRGCPEGTYVRLLDADGEEVDGGSAYWVYDEWVEDPELVMGAILGGAATLEDA